MRTIMPSLPLTGSTYEQAMFIVVQDGKGSHTKANASYNFTMITRKANLKLTKHTNTSAPYQSCLGGGEHVPPLPPAFVAYAVIVQ